MKRIKVTIFVLLAMLFMHSNINVSAESSVINKVNDNDIEERNNLIIERYPKNCDVKLNTYNNSRIEFASLKGNSYPTTTKYLPSDESYYKSIQKQIYDSSLDYIGIHIKSPIKGDKFSLTYSNIGTYKEEKIGATITFTLTSNDISMFNFQTSKNTIYYGFVYATSNVKIDFEIFRASDKKPLTFDNSYISLNSLNQTEGFNIPTNIIKSIDLLENSNISVTTNGKYTKVIGNSDNGFTDYVGGETFNKNTAVIYLNDDISKIELNCITSGIWMTITTNPLTMTMPNNPEKQVNLNEQNIGNKVVYTIYQQINDLAVDTLKKYDTLIFKDQLDYNLECTNFRVYNNFNIDITDTAGTFTITKNTITYTFNKDYLQNIMSYEGEIYKFIIEARIENINKNLIISNYSETKINGYSIMSNKVDIKKLVKVNVITENEGGTITGDEIVEYGSDSSKNVEMNANEGYYISKIAINDKEYLKNSDENITTYKLNKFKNMVENKNIVVTFEKKTLLINAKVDGLGGKVIGNERVKYGEDSTKKININAEEGYYISKIMINDVEFLKNNKEKLSTYTLDKFKNMKEDKNIIVSFEKTKRNKKEQLIKVLVPNTIKSNYLIIFIIIIVILL